MIKIKKRQYHTTHSYKQTNMEQQQFELVQSVLKTFKNAFIGRPMRLGRTKKIHQIFKGHIHDITWTQSKRKGGGFVIWISYKGHIRPHPTILKFMVEEYVKFVDIMISNGSTLKPIRNKTVNSSKDMEILFHNQWQPLEKLFPIVVRELRSLQCCQQWLNTYMMKKTSTLFLKILGEEFRELNKNIILNKNSDNRYKN